MIELATGEYPFKAQRTNFVEMYQFIQNNDGE